MIKIDSNLIASTDLEYTQTELDILCFSGKFEKACTETCTVELCLRKDFLKERKKKPGP